MRYFWFALVVLISGVVGAGCSGNSGAPSAGTNVIVPRAFARTNDKPAYPKEKGTCSIKGQVKLKGNAPIMEKVVSNDPVCTAMHEKTGLYFQTVLVGEKNELENVFVYISKGADEYSFEVPEKPFELSQKDCQFVPRVFGMLSGQALKALNEDGTFHNVRSTSKINAFNLKPGKGEFESCVMKHPEGPTLVVCDVHHWMKGYGAVLTHPFFDVTGPFGKFELKGLLPGEYTLTLWHEALGTQSQTITLSDKEEKSLDITLEVSAK